MSRPLLGSRAFGRYTLSPRVKLVTEQIGGALTSSVGVFVKCGSAHEAARFRGATHLAEHLFFKGTSKHSAEEISQVIERSGGDLNAYTDREFTCFHAWIPQSETFAALKLLLEMLFDSVFDEMEFKKEKEVVIQELYGYEESADDEFLDAFLEVPWKEHPLGLRIGALANEVKKIEHSDIIEHVKDQFLRSEIVISVVSPHKPERVRREVRKALRASEDFSWGPSLKGRLLKSEIPKNFPEQKALAARSQLRGFTGDQVQLGFMYPAAPLGHRDESLWSALISLMGLGSSSYLFRELRENEGLVYSTYASYQAYVPAGLAYGYLATEKKNLWKAVHAAAKVCGFLAAGPSQADIDFIQSSMRGSLLMSFDGVNNRMESLGRQEILLGRVIGLREALKEIEDIQIKPMQRIAQVLGKMPCLFALGPVSARELAKVKRVWKEGLNDQS